MSKSITIDGETADRICLESLGQHIRYLRKSIAKLKKSKPLADYQKTDLGYDTAMLESMKEVYAYYGGTNNGK